jgi:hypothetical protein
LKANRKMACKTIRHLQRISQMLPPQLFNRMARNYQKPYLRFL